MSTGSLLIVLLVNGGVMVHLHDCVYESENSPFAFVVKLPEAFTYLSLSISVYPSFENRL